MRKNKLVIDYDFDFELAGIVSAVKGYKLAWEINHCLDIRLVRQPDLMVGFKGNEEGSFIHYALGSNLNRLKLFRNRSLEDDRARFLVPEFPRFDYILLYQTLTDQKTQEEMKDQLKKIPAIEMIAPIPLTNLKSRSNFIF